MLEHGRATWVVEWLSRWFDDRQRRVIVRLNEDARGGGARAWVAVAWRVHEHGMVEEGEMEGSWLCGGIRLKAWWACVAQ